MKKILLMSALVALQSVIALADCEIPKLPKQFAVQENTLSFFKTFKIVTDNPLESGENLGTIKSKSFHFEAYSFVDSDNNLIATSKQALISFGANVDVFDCEGKRIGGYKQNFMKNITTLRMNYDVYDASGKVIAHAEDVGRADTEFLLKDEHGQNFAALTRSQDLLGDHWNVVLSDNPAVDPRVFVMMAVYKTESDNVAKTTSGDLNQ